MEPTSTTRTSTSPMENPATSNSQSWEKITLFAFGTVCMFTLLAMTHFDPDPTPTTWYIENGILAIAAGGVAALLPGSISLKIRPGLRATGALAIAVLFFYMGFDRSKPEVRNMKNYLLFQQLGPQNPKETDVYVVVNSKLVKADAVTGEPAFTVQDSRLAPYINVARDVGGVRIDCKRLAQDDTLFIALQADSHWWVSDDLSVPEGQLPMTAVSFNTLKKRISNGK